MESNTLFLIISALLGLCAYLLLVWFVGKKLRQLQIKCIWRSAYWAIFLAPGLFLFADHTGIPVPSFAWMSGINNVYLCFNKGLFCSIELNLYMSILPFFATWGFVYWMCNENKE